MKKNIYIVLCALTILFSLTTTSFAYEELTSTQKVLDLTRIEKEADKIIVINFFASYCGFCKKEIPILSELQTKFKDSMILYGISIDNDKKALDKFVQETKLQFPIYTIPYPVAQAFKLQAIPQIFIYKGGILKYKFVGIVSHKVLEKAIRTLL